MTFNGLFFSHSIYRYADMIQRFFKGHSPSGAIPSVGNAVLYAYAIAMGHFARAQVTSTLSNLPIPQGWKAQLGPLNLSLIHI